jgi:flagellar protein FliO/FliZ
MPRMAILVLGALWGILAGAAQAQTASDLHTPDDSAPLRVPAPPQRISADGSWAAPSTAEPQAVSNQEMASRRDSPPPMLSVPPCRPLQVSMDFPEDDPKEPPEAPLAVPLPVPLPPPKLDEAVTPVSFQESVAAEKSRQAENNTASTPDKPSSPAQEKTPLSPQNRPAKIPLAPSGKAGTNNSGKSAGGLPSMISIAGSTGLVLGIFLLLVWIVRRKTPQALVRLPGEAFEILGRAPLSGRQQVQLLRCGSRLLLVSITPGGAETLTEITDPQEVDRLAGLCRQSQPGSSSAAFKQIFEQLAPRRPARSEFLRNGDEENAMSAAGYHLDDQRWEDRNV